MYESYIVYESSGMIVTRKRSRENEYEKEKRKITGNGSEIY